MAKPTEDLDWANNGTVNEIIEPTSAQRLEGIKQGGTWRRQHLNWMLNAAGKWFKWVKDNVRSNDENDTRYVQHTEVVNNLTSTSTTTPLAANQGKDINARLVTVEGTFGSGGAQVQTNAQNKTEFVSHTEVVNNLTSTSTITPLSAAQGRALKLIADANLVTTSSVLAATSAAAAGVVGSYMLAQYTTVSGKIEAGGVVSGSSLRMATGVGSVNTSGSLSGSWRCMGMIGSGNAETSGAATTLWLRVS